MARLIWRGADDAAKAAYVKERTPDFIVTPSRAGVPDLRFLAAEEGWFRDHYRAASLWRGGPDGYELTLFVRSDVVPRASDQPGGG